MRCCIELRRAGPGRGRSARALALLLGGLLLFLPGCGKKPTATELDVFFTSQTHGRLTHCGCFSGQYGGLARLRSAVETLLGPAPLGVDVGDALEGTEDYHLLKHREVLSTYAALGYAAVNAGVREAGLPAETLRQLAAQSPVPFLGANLRERATGRPVLMGWTVVERGGRRIGLAGVVDPRGLEDRLGSGLELEPMESALARLLPELRRSADVLILLAYADEAALQALARQFYEFAIVLGGRVSQPAPKLEQVNRSLVYYTGNESKSFGLLQLHYGEKGTVRPGQHRIVLLNDEFPEHPEVLARLQAYRGAVAQARLTLDDPQRARAGTVPGTRAVASYAGSESCAGCHPTAARTWRESRHGHAFASLVERGAQSDPSCVGCHTVGFGTPSGYQRVFAGEKLTQVGCESCHGPGSLHVEQRQAGGAVSFQFRPLGAGDCLKCHFGEFSRPFVMDQFWPRIAHGREPGTTRNLPSPGSGTAEPTAPPKKP